MLPEVHLELHPASLQPGLHPGLRAAPVPDPVPQAGLQQVQHRLPDPPLLRVLPQGRLQVRAQVQQPEVLHQVRPGHVQVELQVDLAVSERLPAADVHVELPEPGGVPQARVQAGLREAPRLRPELRAPPAVPGPHRGEVIHRGPGQVGHLRLGPVQRPVRQGLPDQEGPLQHRRGARVPVRGEARYGEGVRGRGGVQQVAGEPVERVQRDLRQGVPDPDGHLLQRRRDRVLRGEALLPGGLPGPRRPLQPLQGAPVRQPGLQRLAGQLRPGNLRHGGHDLPRGQVRGGLGDQGAGGLLLGEGVPVRGLQPPEQGVEGDPSRGRVRHG
mmetsp:Transcript_42173/g.101419  ORF Transcript_42173/g.101419 Transcript_42173/m.101419 type:complete len:328 (+) Transcript_42173:465-1448(+)